MPSKLSVLQRLIFLEITSALSSCHQSINQSINNKFSDHLSAIQMQFRELVGRSTRFE